MNRLREPRRWINELLTIALQHCRIFRTTHFGPHPSSSHQHVRELCDLDFGAHSTTEALSPRRTFMQPNRPRDRSHPQRRHRQDEPPGPIAAQGFDRKAARAKACRKVCASEDSKALAATASTPEPL